MKFLAEIEILPHAGLLDPQGKTVHNSLPSIGINQVTHVRVGKFITLEVEANSEEECRNIAQQCCERLLVNAIMETSKIRIAPLGV